MVRRNIDLARRIVKLVVEDLSQLDHIDELHEIIEQSTEEGEEMREYLADIVVKELDSNDQMRILRGQDSF